jgi:hypothetical protein
MSETIADYPAYRIYKPYAGRKFKDGDKIAIPFKSARYGKLYHFFTLGTVAGYAIRNGDDPIEAIERCKRNMVEHPHNGHKLYWANANSVTIHNGPYTKEEVPGFEFGDEIILQGKRFRLEPDHNDNCKLVEV